MDRHAARTEVVTARSGDVGLAAQAMQASQMPAHAFDGMKTECTPPRATRYPAIGASAAGVSTAKGGSAGSQAARPSIRAAMAAPPRTLKSRCCERAPVGLRAKGLGLRAARTGLPHRCGDASR